MSIWPVNARGGKYPPASFAYIFITIPHCFRLFAQLARLAANKVKYAEPDNAVRGANQSLKNGDRTPAELRKRTEEVHARIADLHAIAEQYPDYPHMAHLYHIVGVNHLWIKM